MASRALHTMERKPPEHLFVFILPGKPPKGVPEAREVGAGSLGAGEQGGRQEGRERIMWGYSLWHSKDARAQGGRQGHIRRGGRGSSSSNVIPPLGLFWEPWWLDAMGSHG